MFDVEALSHLCKILYMYDFALDITALHARISDLVFHALSLLDEYDCETVGSLFFRQNRLRNIHIRPGDPQTAVSHLGDIVLFAQCAIARFHVSMRPAAVRFL